MNDAAHTELAMRNDSHSSGVAWTAVIAGTFVIAALSLTLLTLGTGVGFSVVSPWTNAGASSKAIGWGAVVWIVIIQVIASSVGGYLTGRLRTRWISVHTHEVYFRDTAHGFLAWAVSLVITAAFLTSAAAAVIGGISHSAATSPAAPESRENAGPTTYFVDSLFRSSGAISPENNAAARNEVALIFSHGLKERELPEADKSYLARLIAAKTGVPAPEAQKRVDDAFNQAREAADQARKALAHSMYWTFLALLVGAFSASFAATLGGKQRDRVPIT
jgi:hypothetical protein